MDGGCGGFLFACCQRQRSINSGSSRGENVNYGPVVNDECKYISNGNVVSLILCGVVDSQSQRPECNLDY